MACLNKMLLALTIIAAGMIIGTATKAVDVEEYREVMGHGMDPSGWKIGYYFPDWILKSSYFTSKTKIDFISKWISKAQWIFITKSK